MKKLWLVVGTLPQKHLSSAVLLRVARASVALEMDICWWAAALRDPVDDTLPNLSIVLILSPLHGSPPALGRWSWHAHNTSYLFIVGVLLFIHVIFKMVCLWLTSDCRRVVAAVCLHVDYYCKYRIPLQLTFWVAVDWWN